MVLARTIRSADCRVMPWKNGQGSTTEIVVEPPGAALDAFDWRLSIAELRGSGPFSTFPGYDRIIVQLDGPPMTLTHGAEAPVVLEQLVPHAFSGDEETTCTVAGVAHDFNLIARRGVGRPTLTVHRLDEGEELMWEDGGVAALHVLEGAMEAEDGIRLADGDTRVGTGVGLIPHRATRCSVVIAALLAETPSERGAR